MSIDDLPKFQAASEAAERWLVTVSMVVHLGQTGNVDEAFKLLMPTLPTKNGRLYNLQDSYNEHVEVLKQARDLLATLSDAPVIWEHGRGRSGVARVPAAVYPHIWSSAHEAAAGIARLALEVLAWPVGEITDPSEQWTLAEQLLAQCWQALTIPLDEEAKLRERIRRERAKLLVQVPSSCSMLASANYAPSEQLPPEGSKFTEQDAPAPFREGGKANGKVLTTNYLEETPEWKLLGPYLSTHYGPGKPLTTHIKVGRSKAYLFKEVAALRIIKTANQAKREERR
jgi:hypothetical protein